MYVLSVVDSVEISVEIARGTSRGPKEISRSEGMYNPIHPDLRQCTSILSVSDLFKCASLKYISPLLSSLIHTEGCIRKYTPAGQVVLAVLKSILPC